MSTGWPAVRDTCDRLGLGFDSWQDGSGRLILAKRGDGLYAADTVVISIPRQVGKTYLIGAIVFALCIIIPGLTVVWTAHRFKTARETFDQMKGIAVRERVKPHVATVVNGAGDEAIKFRNGSRVLFGARERGFGRGFSKVDVLVLDEGQILGESAMDDMIPATNQSDNPLVLLMGTPPKPSDPGEVFTMLRQEALDGETEGTLYIEFSADRGCDPLDRDQWRKANASYPARTSERAILRMWKNLSPDSFMREALGIWDEFTRHRAVIKKARWRDLSDVGPAGGTRPNALAVDMSHDRQISVSACWIDGESAHAEEVWAGTGVDEAIEWIVAHSRRRDPVVIDVESPAVAMVPTLRARRMNVVQATAGDVAKGCGLLIDKVSASQFTHGDQKAVNEALERGRKRAMGSAGRWVWDRTDSSVYIAPISSMTLALFGAEGSKQARTNGRSSSRREAVVL